MQKKESSGDGVGYVRKEPYEYEGKHFDADIKDGDTVTILDGGVNEEGKFGVQTYFRIETRNGVKKAPFNQSSINVLIDAYGAESEDWKNKTAKVITKKGIFGGQKAIAAYFVTEGWKLDDFGELVKEGEEVEQVNEDDIPY